MRSWVIVLASLLSGCGLLFDFDPRDEGLALDGSMDAHRADGCGPEICNAFDDDCDGRIDEDFDFSNDVLHCGACNRACTAVEFALGSVCLDGACTPTCDGTHADCNDIYDDGCEIAITTSTACGSCSMGCLTSEVCLGLTCVDGSLCDPGFMDCNGRENDGCEVNLENDRQNCGGCGRTCASGENCCFACCTTQSCGPLPPC